MAIKKPKPKFTAEEQDGAVEQIKAVLADNPWFLKRFKKLSVARQRRVALRMLDKVGLKRTKAGAPDWKTFFTELKAFIQFLFELLGPLLVTV